MAQTKAQLIDGKGDVDLGALSISGSAPDNSVNLDSSGRLLVGTSTARAAFNNTTHSPLFQIEGASSSGAAAGRFVSQMFGSSGNADPMHILARHRSDSVGGITIVASDDRLGTLSFQGSDGSEFVPAAEITAAVDGTPGANDMPGRLAFFTTADGTTALTERMRIDSTGKISASAGSVVHFESSTTGTTAHYNALLNGSQVFVVNFNGDVRIAAGKTYGNLSDASVKENIVDATPKLDDVCRLQVRNFSVKNDAELGKYIGFIAQEFETVFPALVQEDAEGLKGIKESALIPILVKALQESTERIKALEAKVAALEAA